MSMNPPPPSLFHRSLCDIEDDDTEDESEEEELEQVNENNSNKNRRIDDEMEDELNPKKVYII